MGIPTSNGTRLSSLKDMLRFDTDYCVQDYCLHASLHRRHDLAVGPRWAGPPSVAGRGRTDVGKAVPTDGKTAGIEDRLGYL